MARNSCPQLQPRSVLGSFDVVLVPCKVNFHLVRSTLQNSMYLLFADQFFIDLTLCGIFVCDPSQFLKSPSSIACRAGAEKGEGRGRKARANPVSLFPPFPSAVDA